MSSFQKLIAPHHTPQTLHVYLDCPPHQAYYNTIYCRKNPCESELPVDYFFLLEAIHFVFILKNLGQGENFHVLPWGSYDDASSPSCSIHHLMSLEPIFFHETEVVPPQFCLADSLVYSSCTSSFDPFGESELLSLSPKYKTVYFPHLSYLLTDNELKKRGFDRQRLEKYKFRIYHPQFIRFVMKHLVARKNIVFYRIWNK